MSKGGRTRGRRGGRGGSKGGGLLRGMRSGFKNVTGSVTGAGEPKAKARSSLFNTVVTVLLVAATAALLWRRFGR